MINENEQGYLVRMDDGSLVERDVLNIIEKIRDYDPCLKVQYLEHAANINDAPWRLIELCKDGKWRTVFYFWELNEKVLHRLYAADTHFTDVQHRLEKNNENIRRADEQRYKERILEAHDITKTFLKSRQNNKWTFKNEQDELVTIEDHGNRRR